MARIVVTYAVKDGPIVERISAMLTERAGHAIVPLQGLRLSGEGLKDRAVVEITQADYVLAVLSRNSWATPGFAFELGLVRSLEVTLQRNVLVGIVLDDAPVPTVMGSRPIVRFSTLELDSSLGLLSRLLLEPVMDIRQQGPIAFRDAWEHIAGDEAVPGWAQGIADLGTVLADRQLVLFLGAGVSQSAGVPDWHSLVDRVIGKVFDRVAVGTGLASDDLAALMRSRAKASDLVLAQHAQRELGTEFYGIVQAELYRGALGTSDLLSALGELAEGGRARAAVTYNFDDFFERELRLRGVRPHTVAREGNRTSDGFPVFHVHGLIKRTGYVYRRSLVFAEAEFHDESLDPYRWSALVQISHLSHSTCLFIGTSVQDPNLRRLLEVIKKRSPEALSPHFVIFRHTDPAAIAGDKPALSPTQATRSAEVIDRLVEGDLNDLGLQVIWVEQHAEIPDLVRELATGPADPGLT